MEPFLVEAGGRLVCRAFKHVEGPLGVVRTITYDRSRPPVAQDVPRGSRRDASGNRAQVDGLN